MNPGTTGLPSKNQKHFSGWLYPEERVNQQINLLFTWGF